MTRETKKEIKIYSVKRKVYKAYDPNQDSDASAVEEDKFDNVIYLEFVMNGMPLSRTSATINDEGQITRINVYEDLDGDGQVNAADDDLMKNLAAGYAKLQWSPELVGKKEIQIYAEDEDANGRAESIATQFLLDEKNIGGASIKMNPEGEVTDIHINADLNGDDNIDVSDEQIMKNIALAYAKVQWPY